MNINRTVIISYYVIKRQQPVTYLEVGVRSSKLNFDLIPAAYKDGIDPHPASQCNYHMTSDQFFATNSRQYDVVFIDGLHIYEQAYRDVINAERFLKPDGVIIMHDCSPGDEYQQDGREHRGFWTGTVWKAFVHLRCTRSDLEMFVIDADFGVGVIKRGKQKPYAPPVGVDIFKYSEFDKHRKEALNLITGDEWLVKEGYVDRSGEAKER